MKIILIRHGKTVFNKERRYTGCQDIPLSLEGIKELKRVKENLTTIENYKLYTSDLKRTHQTSQILFPNKAISNSFKEFNEMNLGDFETHTYDELKNQSDYQEWLNDIYSVQCPNGESFQDFKNRVTSKFNTLLKTKEDFCLVSHGGTIQMILSQIIDPTLSFFEIKVKNGLGYFIEYQNNKFTYEEIL